MNNNKILSINNITKKYPIQRGVFKRTVGYAEILKSISFDIEQGETFAIVGESGCGKSTLARIIMCLEPPSNGEIIYNNNRIDNLPTKKLLEIRKSIQIVFQDPSSALNERFTVEQILLEPLIIHKLGNKKDNKQLVYKTLNQVELDEGFASRYLHELSGGQKQRVAIARSIILKPNLLLLDEPLSALDVVTQSQIVKLLNDLQAKLGITIIIISHDLGLVKSFSDRVLVLHFGEAVEIENTKELFQNPKHSYTKKLIDSII